MNCKLKGKIPVRTYTGEQWRTNYSNKKRLAIDFDNRCAYCDDHHRYGGGYNSYHVEHFAPKEKFRILEFTYDNLLYSCPYCNISKSDKWISTDPTISVIQDKGFIDPCTEEYYEHLERDDKGKIIYKTKLGEYMFCELKLYLYRHQAIYNMERILSKKKLLEAKIIENNTLKKDTSILEYLHKELCVIFVDYYELFSECEEGTYVGSL